MIERTFHPNKKRDIVQYTGSLIEDAEVEKLGLEDDYCLTINQVADMLDLHVTTVQTYIIPRLNVAEAGMYIRSYMNNPRLKRVVSKTSLIDFLGWYVDSVKYDCDTYTISRVDSKADVNDMTLENRLISEISEVLENKKRVQPFLNYASRWLEKNHFADYQLTQKEEEDRIDDCIYSILNNNIMSFNQVKKHLNLKHNEQVKRWLEKNAHTKLILNSLDKTGSAKRDNVRYILKDNIIISSGNVVDEANMEHGKPYFLNIFDKTKSALSNLETEEPLYVSVLYVILQNINNILPSFEAWEREKKKKKTD